MSSKDVDLDMNRCVGRDGVDVVLVVFELHSSAEVPAAAGEREKVRAR